MSWLLILPFLRCPLGDFTRIRSLNYHHKFNELCETSHPFLPLRSNVLHKIISLWYFQVKKLSRRVSASCRDFSEAHFFKRDKHNAVRNNAILPQIPANIGGNFNIKTFLVNGKKLFNFFAMFPVCFLTSPSSVISRYAGAPFDRVSPLS